MSAASPPTRPPAGSVTDDDRRRRQTTDPSEQNNTGPFGWPVIIIIIIKHLYDALVFGCVESLDGSRDELSCNSEPISVKFRSNVGSIRHLCIKIGLSRCVSTGVAWIDGRSRAAGSGGKRYNKAGPTKGRADGQADGPMARRVEFHYFSW